MQLPAGAWSGSLTSVAVVSGVPLLATLLMAQREVWLRRILPQLTGFGAGAVFGAAVAHLLPEARRHGQSLLFVAAGATGGFLLFWLIERILAGHDHAHAHGIALGAPSAHESDRSEADCVHLHATPAEAVASVGRARALAPMTFVGDAVHNLVDGMLIAAGFLTEPSVGLFTVLAVGLHELPREIGTFSLFVHGGIRPMRAVAYNLITAVVAMAGAALTLVVGARVAEVATYLLPIAAGTYLYIAQAVGRASLHDGHADPVHWERLPWILAGTAAMVATSLLA